MFRPTRSEGKVKLLYCSVSLLVSSCWPALDFSSKVNLFSLSLSAIFVGLSPLIFCSPCERCISSYISLTENRRQNRIAPVLFTVFFLKGSCISSALLAVSGLVPLCEWTHQPSSIAELFQINSFTHIYPILSCAHPLSDNAPWLLPTLMHKPWLCTRVWWSSALESQHPVTSDCTKLLFSLILIQKPHTQLQSPYLDLKYFSTLKTLFHSMRLVLLKPNHGPKTQVVATA